MTASKRIALALLMILTIASLSPVAAIESWTAGDASASLAAVDVEMRGLPPVTAPGATIPLHWVTSGGSQVTSTRVFYDSITHIYDRNYPYGSPLQSGNSGAFFDYIDVPLGWTIMYLTPYAVVDGEIVYGREYTVPMRRAVNLGSDTMGDDDNQDWWGPDLDWYGQAEGGVPNLTTQGIADTPDDWIYQSQREGIESYTCNLTAGVMSMDLEVEIHLAEFDATGPMQRVFDIRLEPNTPHEVLISDIDVYSAVGSHRAMVITRTVTVDRTYDASQYRNELDVVFSSAYGHEPICNGIVLRGLEAIPQRQCSQVPVISADDTYINSNFRTEAVVRLGGQGEYHGGLRFQFLPVPQDAVINRAYLWVTASQDTYQDLKLTLYAHDVDNAPDFGPGESVGARVRTTSSVQWNVPRAEGWIGGRVYQSPDLTELVQEVISRPGWQPRHALSLLLMGGNGDSDGRRIWAYDGSPADSAVLYIDYTPRDQAAPTPVPTFTFTPTPTDTATPTVTPTYTSTPEATATSTATPTPEHTATPTVTLTVTPSMTPQSRGMYLPLVLLAAPMP